MTRILGLAGTGAGRGCLGLAMLAGVGVGQGWPGLAGATRSCLGPPGLPGAALGWPGHSISRLILESPVSPSLLKFFLLFAQRMYFRNSSIKHATPY